MGTHRRCGSVCRYLDRRAERLVVEAFRHWKMGGESGSLRNFDRTTEFFVDELGPVEGRTLFLAFLDWQATIDSFRDGPAAASPVECPLLCRDECMALAMVAAAQAADRESVEAASGRLVDSEGIAPTIIAAERFAAALAQHGHHLLPVPAAVVREIADRPTRQAFH